MAPPGAVGKSDCIGHLLPLVPAGEEVVAWMERRRQEHAERQVAHLDAPTPHSSPSFVPKNSAHAR
jgi:hypothetical protein